MNPIPDWLVSGTHVRVNPHTNEATFYRRDGTVYVAPLKSFDSSGWRMVAMEAPSPDGGQLSVVVRDAQ